MEKLVSQVLGNIHENPYILIPIGLLILIFGSRYFHHVLIQKARNPEKFASASTYKVFSPVDGKEREGSEDLKYQLGSLRGQISSQKLTLLGSLIFFSGIIFPCGDVFHSA